MAEIVRGAGAVPTGSRRRSASLAPNAFEVALALAAVALLLAVATALLRGHAAWGRVPPVIWLHLAPVGLALALTPLMLLRRRGDGLHRGLGWAWAVLMFAGAAASFGVRTSGRFSPIHILSVVVVIAVPFLVLNARSHRVAAHRRSVQGLVLGALVIAGAFTLIPHRLLGRWLFG